jgi:hypothetical protein
LKEWGKINKRSFKTMKMIAKIRRDLKAYDLEAEREFGESTMMLCDDLTQVKF